MRTSELKKRLGITSKAHHWPRAFRPGCLQATHGVGAVNTAFDWNDRDANWLIRLYERNPKKTGYYPTHLLTKHYKYAQKACTIPRCLDQYKKPDRWMDDQWRDMIHETAVRLRTYQIMLAALSQDAAKAGCEPLDSWTDTDLYDEQEREEIIKATRKREPNV